VGVIFYECLFGQAPFKSDSLEEVIAKATEDDPVVLPQRPHLSPHCRDLLSKCLQRNPEERITFSEFFSHSFLDLEHAPSVESEVKARAAEARAICADSQGDYSLALVSYR